MSESGSGKPAGYVPVPTLRTGQSHPLPNPLSGETYSAVELMPGYRVVLLDQRKLPAIERYEFFSRVEDVAEAIRNMTVRGAPAIGITAAYGMVTAAAAERGDANAFFGVLKNAKAVLGATRPTAVNLAWALDKMMTAAQGLGDQPFHVRTENLARAAREIHMADVAACRAMGAAAVALVPEGATILTHCNAGALATGGYGTALGVIRAAHEAGKKIRVLACETRPYLQGARLTAWELHKSKIPVEVITDSMAAHFMAKREIQLVVVGADRIAKNGDVANKIGTYMHACLARAHEIPFYVAAPFSTVDLACPNGDAIPIEQRGERELSHWSNHEGVEVRVVPEGVGVRNPSFDVTPAGLIKAIFTERGVSNPPYELS